MFIVGILLTPVLKYIINEYEEVKDEYVIHNCAYWNYAYLDENGWKDIDDAKNDIEWVSQYFDNFCANLKDTDKVTIFECTKDKVEN